MRLGWKLPLRSLSASSLGAAITCPELFRQRYIVRDRDDDVMFGSRFVGIVDHRVNERILRDKINPPVEPLKPEDLLIDKLYQKVWNEAISELGEPDWRDDDPLKMQATGVKMAQAYHAQVDVKPVALEQKVEFRIQGVPVPIKGYVDVIERNLIRERKTTGAKTTKPKAKWRFQGLIYQYAVGLPVQWDVITRQVTPQVFTADVWPDLLLPMTNLKVAETLIRDAARRVNDLYTQYGPTNPWPMEGLHTDWLCSYCVIGPKYEGTCLAWSRD